MYAEALSVALLRVTVRETRTDWTSNLKMGKNVSSLYHESKPTGVLPLQQKEGGLGAGELFVE